MKRWVGLAVGLVASIGMGGALAQGVLRIGMVAGFTGPVASIVQESAEGARLYFDSVNAQGGIKGQTIELVTADDKYDNATAVAQAKSLAGQGVLALMLSRGTGPTEALLPVLKDNKLALIAPATGAISLHEPMQPFVFHLRASYQKEAERAVKHLAGVGVKRFTIVQVNDPFATMPARARSRVWTTSDCAPCPTCAMTATSPISHRPCRPSPGPASRPWC